jgi:hypothetical protein
MTRRTDNAVVGWMIAAGFALGCLLVPSAPERHTDSHGYGSTSYYEPQPRRDVKPAPACPKGQDIATVTLAQGMIAGVTCGRGKPIER